MIGQKFLDSSWVEIKGVKMHRLEMRYNEGGKRIKYLTYSFQHPDDQSDDEIRKAWHYFSFKSEKKWYKRYLSDAEAIVRSVVWEEKTYEKYWYNILRH